MPYFSTDTVAAQRALETHCRARCSWARTASTASTTPTRGSNPDAVKLDHLTYTEALVNGLGVMDATAMSLCRDNDVPMRVFGMDDAGNVTRALQGEKIGTLVTAG